MSINKQMVLDAVSRALDGMGMGDMGGDEYGEDDSIGPNEVPIWSKLQVGVNDEGRGPIHDKSALFGMDRTSKPPTVDNYGMPVDDDASEMMSALGLV
jgi:hypothetical protein